jgi:hypothetical protein
VDVIAEAQQQGLKLPFTLQVSPDHHGHYDAATKTDLARLQSLHYAALALQTETLSSAAYQQLFQGAICLQPYRLPDFADRISGVTLDALSAGSPIVSSPDTWIARQVLRFDAGVVVEAVTPTQILRAIDSIRENYAHYAQNALLAGQTLQEEHSATQLAQLILGHPR